jgi:hypothetical protein
MRRRIMNTGEIQADCERIHERLRRERGPVRKRPWCCFAGCEQDAEFEIIAVRPGSLGMPTFVGTIDYPANVRAGPDRYSDDTHACTLHVGYLLGHQPDAKNPDEIFWEVRALKDREPPVSGFKVLDPSVLPLQGHRRIAQALIDGKIVEAETWVSCPIHGRVRGALVCHVPVCSACETTNRALALGQAGK